MKDTAGGGESHRLPCFHASPRPYPEGGRRTGISFILFRCCCPKVFQGQSVGNHIEATRHESRKITRYPRNQRRRGRLFGRHAEKCGHAKCKSKLKSAANPRYLDNRSDSCSNQNQSCGRNREVEIHSEQHEPKLEHDENPNGDGVSQGKTKASCSIEKRQTIREVPQQRPDFGDRHKAHNALNVRTEKKQKSY